MTSLLERVNAALANAVTGGRNGQEHLGWLDAHNLFLIPLDDSRSGYRYHHLFAEFLRHRLRQLQPGRVAKIYRRAAQWHAEQHAPTEAIEYALAAGEVELAARLVEANFDGYWTRGQFTTLRRWFSQAFG